MKIKVKRNPPNKKESILCKQVVKVLRVEYIYVWERPFMIIYQANERRSSGKDKLKDIIYSNHQKAMGLITGMADYIIINNLSNAIFIEVKNPDSKNPFKDLSDAQIAFREDAIKCNIPYHVSNNYDEIIEIVKQHTQN